MRQFLSQSLKQLESNQSKLGNIELYLKLLLHVTSKTKHLRWFISFIFNSGRILHSSILQDDVGQGDGLGGHGVRGHRVLQLASLDKRKWSQRAWSHFSSKTTISWLMSWFIKKKSFLKIYREEKDWREKHDNNEFQKFHNNSIWFTNFWMYTTIPRWNNVNNVGLLGFCTFYIKI